MKLFTNSRLLPALLALLLLQSTSFAWAQKAKSVTPKAAPNPVQELQNWDNKLSTLQTSFNQTTSYDGVLISQSDGLVYYDKAENLLRLDTLNKEGKKEQSAVTDKKTLYILDALDKDITSMPWQEWQEGQPNKALYDFGNYTALLNEHNASVFGKKGRLIILLLEPKNKADYRLYITLDEADYFPVEIKIESDLMQTVAALQYTQKNLKLKAGLFGRVKK